MVLLLQGLLAAEGGGRAGTGGGRSSGSNCGSGLVAADVASSGADVAPLLYMQAWLSLMAGPLGLRMPLPLPQQHPTAGTQTHPQAAE
jgi:hypothetical protein